MGGITRLNNNSANIPQKIKHIENKVVSGPAIVLVWADWCPHCVTMRPAWDATVSAGKAIKADFAEIESRHLKAVEGISNTLHKKITSAGHVSFPTILMFKNGNKPVVYDKERNQDTMIKTFKEFANNSKAQTKTTKKSPAKPSPQPAKAPRRKKEAPGIEKKSQLASLKNAMDLAANTEQPKPRRRISARF